VAERKNSAPRDIGLVVCPECRGVEVPCALCAGTRRVAVDVAVGRTMDSVGARPGALGANDPGKPATPAESGSVLLAGALDTVLADLAAAGDSAEVKVLRERARDLKAVIVGWRQVIPNVREREAVSRKVLALHVAVRQVTRPEKK
jgi:hypothetical protein